MKWTNLAIWVFEKIRKENSSLSCLSWKRNRTRISEQAVFWRLSYPSVSPLFLSSLEGRPMSVLRLAYITSMTGDRNDELAAMDLNTIAVALTPSWLLRILTAMPIWQCFSSFLFCFVLFLSTKLYMLNECLLCLIFITITKLTIKLSVRTLKAKTFHFVFSLRIFVSARVIIT